MNAMADRLALECGGKRVKGARRRFFVRARPPESKAASAFAPAPPKLCRRTPGGGRGRFKPLLVLLLRRALAAGQHFAGGDVMRDEVAAEFGKGPGRQMGAQIGHQLEIHVAVVNTHQPQP